MKNKIIFGGITVVLIIVVIVGSSILNTTNSHNILDDIVFEEGKVNIYYFWGDGCPHCRAQSEFFESIKEEYGEYFNLHKFEIWYNEDNARLLIDFSNKMGERITAVPYTIIGEKTFNGFNNAMKADIINAIIVGSQNDFDVVREINKR